MPPLQNIAIIGAGGRIGGIITTALLAQNLHTITAITRPDSTSTLPSGLHAVREAAYTDHAALVAALRGQDVLVITMNVLAPKDTQARLIDAAVEAGVPWIMPNEWGADSADHVAMGNDTGLGPPQQAVRAYIETRGQGRTRWVSLACSFWYEFSLAGTEARYGFDFGKRTLTLINEGRTRINTSTWPQVGRAVARLLALPAQQPTRAATGLSLDQVRNRAVCVSSFHVSQRDMLASVLRVTGTSESEWTVTSEGHAERFVRGKKMMQEGNFMGFGILLYTRAFFPDDPADFQHKLDNAGLGLYEEEDLDAATKIAVELSEKAGGAYGTKV